MFPQPDSSSDNLRRLSADISPDQSCSSDTGDVLIRSTRVRHEAEVGPGPGSVKITVQKVREPPVQPPVTERQQQNAGTEKQQPRQKPDNGLPLRAAVHSQPGKSSGRWFWPTGGLSCDK